MPDETLNDDSHADAQSAPAVTGSKWNLPASTAVALCAIATMGLWQAAGMMRALSTHYWDRWGVQISHVALQAIFVCIAAVLLVRLFRGSRDAWAQCRALCWVGIVYYCAACAVMLERIPSIFSSPTSVVFALLPVGLLGLICGALGCESARAYCEVLGPDGMAAGQRLRRLVLVVGGALVSVLVATVLLALCGIQAFGFLAAFPPVELQNLVPVLPECAFVQTHFMGWLSPIGFGLIFILPAVSLLLLAWVGPPIAARVRRAFGPLIRPRRRAIYLTAAIVAACILLAELAAINAPIGHGVAAFFHLFALWCIGVATFGLIVGFAVVVVDCAWSWKKPRAWAWPALAAAIFLIGFITIGLIGQLMIWADQAPIRQRHSEWQQAVAADPAALRGGSNIGSDEDLKLLRNTKRLKRLDLNYCCLTAARLQYLEGLNQLEDLSLQGAFPVDRTSDSCLDHLKSLTQLQELNLSSNLGITDIGVEHLKGLTQLRKLDLSLTRTTDAGLEYLRGMTELRELDLGSTKITAAGLERLNGLGKLERLTLDRAKIGDAGSACLKAFPSLQFLDLRGTGITDAGLSHLETLSQLKYLGLPTDHSPINCLSNSNSFVCCCFI